MSNDAYIEEEEAVYDLQPEDYLEDDPEPEDYLESKSAKSLGELLKEKIMSEEEKKAPKVEDLVKTAIKEAMEKRKVAETSSPKEIKETVAAEVVAKTTKVKKTALRENQQWASEVVGEKLKNDFPVTMYKKEDWNEAVQEFIPKINASYELVKEQAEAILRAWELNEKVLVYGPTGAGKSSLIEQLCALTSRPFVRVNCTGDMDSSMIFGQLTANSGSTVWQDGVVTEAVRHGAVFAWDEWDVTPPEIAMGLQWLLEDEGKLFLKEMPGSSHDKFITPHEAFRVVAIGNTQGQGDDTGAHAGTNVQNSATLDRFGTTIRVGYLPEAVEIKLLITKFPEYVTEVVAQGLVKLANLVRQGYTSGQLALTMSPRALFGISKKLTYGCTVLEAFDLVYANKLPDVHQKVARELYRKIYGSK
jgi:cobaltochelatase CobS